MKPARGRRHASSDAHATLSMFGGSLLSLESRIMFDGAAVATVSTVTTEQIAQSQADASLSDHDSATADTAPAAPTGEPQPTTGDQALFDALAAYDTSTARQEIVFLSPSVLEYQQLLDGISPNVEVIVLDPARDGVEQMAETLAGRTGIDAIHIISHGAQAELTLGTGRLTLDSMNGIYADELAAISQSLSEKADMLIYGCNFGLGERGAEAAMRLGQLTGADVAASTDGTGHASLGGDWDLEFTTDLIETRTVVCQPVLEKWFGLLDTTSLQATQDTYIKLKSPDDVNNFGVSTSLVVDRESKDLQRALLQFDLSSIPVGSTINSATLKLQSTQIGGTLNINVYEVTQAWSEGTGNGAAGAANWNESQTGTNWTTSGGTFNSTAVATLNTNATGQHTWNVTSLVQAWFNGTNVNNGLMVASPDKGGNRTATYDSSEGTTVPVLEINYTLPSNTAPTITNLSGDSLSYAEGDGAVVIEQGGNATVSDVDSADFDTGSLVGSFVAGSDISEDVLAIRNEGTGAGQIGVSGSNVTYGGATIGTFAGGSSGANLVVTFNSSATPTAAQALIRNITYQNTDTDAPTTGTRTVRFVLTDGDGGSSGTHDTTITVTPVNDAPVVDLNAGGVGNNVTTAFTEQTPVLIAPIATLTDVDSANLSSLTVTLTARPDGNAVESLALNAAATTAASGAGLTVSYTAGTGVLSITGSATRAVYESILQGILYNDTSNTPTTSNRTINVVTNDGTTASVTRTVTLTVAAVNDAPANTVPGAQGVNEDTALALGGISVTDVDGNLSTVQLGVAQGTVTVNLAGGATISAGANGTATLTLSGTQAQINAALATLVYQGTLNYTGPDTLTVTSTDTNAVTDVDTVALTVTPVNDAPTITAIADQGVLEDGTTGALPFTVGDVETAVGSLTVTAVSSNTTLIPNGNLTLVDLGGGNWTITATPALNQNGGPVTITVTVSDGTTATTETFDVTVTPVNDTPAGTDTTVTTAEDTVHVFTVANFGFTDVDASDSLSAVRIDSLPLAGSLTLSGVGVAAGDVILATDITAGNLVFTPALNANGASYASFTFSVRDQANAFDGAPNTMTIDVTPVNDAPANTVPGAQGVNEDTALALGGISVTDVDGNLSTVQLGVAQGTVTVNLAGGATISAGANGTATLTLSGTQAQINAALATLVYQGTLNYTGPDTLTVTSTDTNAVTDVDTVALTVTPVNDAPTITAIADQGVLEDGTTGALPFTVGDVETAVGSLTVTAVSSNTTLIPNGNLTLVDLGGGNWTITATPALNQNGGPVTITVTVSDGTTATTETFDVTVTPVNDTPAGTDTTVTTAEDTVHVFTVANFGFTDVDASDSLSAVRIDSLPLAGSLTLSGVGVAAGDVILATDITAGNLVFTPALNANGASYASFTFSVRDQANAFDGAPNTMTIDVTPVNDAPANTVPGAQGVNEDTALALGGISVTDVDGNLSTVQLGVAQGTVTVNLAGGATISAGANGTATLTLSGTQAQINAALATLVYQGTLNYTGPDTLTVTSTDTNAVTDVDTVALTVTPVNDAPTITAIADQGVLEDGTTGALPFTVGDVETAVGSLTVTAVSSNTTLIPNGNLTLVDLGGGNWTITATPALNQNGGPVTITVTVSDGTTATTETFDVTVTPVNDTPAGTDTTVTTAEDTVHVFTVANFGFTDVDASDSLSAVRIDSLPLAGSLTLSGVGVAAGDVILATDITAGNLVFTPALNANGASYASFTFSVRDQANAFDGAPNTMTIDVTPVNDAPANTVPGAQGVNEDTALALGGISVTDVDGNLSTVQLGVAQGTVTVNLAGGATISAGANGTATLTLSGTQAQINAALATLVYQGTLNYTGPDTLTVTSTDTNAVTDVDTVALTVTPVNDAPTITAIADQGVLEDGTTGALPFTVGDVETAVGSLTVTAVSSNTTLIPNGNLTLVDLGGGNWTITATPALNQNGGPVTITVTVSDGTTATTETFDVTVTPVNDTPAGTDTTVTTAEDTVHVFTVANFGFTDVDASDSLSAVRIDSLPLAGSLTLSGVGVAAGDVILATDITAGNLVFTPALNANGASYASFTFSVRDQANAFDGAPNTMTIDVTPVNDAPANTVPGAQGVNEDTALALGGISVTDVDGNLSTVQLGVAQGTVTVNLAGGATISAGANGTATLTLSGTQAQINAALATLVYQGTLNYTGPDTLTVTSTDTNAVTDVDTVALTVTPVNDAPVVSSNGGGATAAVNVAENQAVGTTVASTDVDGGVPTYSIIGGADAALFTLNAATGALTFNSAPDFEVPIDAGANNVYDITVQVADGSGGTDIQALSIIVTDLSEGLPPTTPPPVIPPSLVPQPPAPPPGGGLPPVGSPPLPPIIVRTPISPQPNPEAPVVPFVPGNDQGGTAPPPSEMLGAPAPKGENTPVPSVPLMRELRGYLEERVAPLIYQAGEDVRRTFGGQTLEKAPVPLSAVFRKTLMVVEEDLRRATEMSESNRKFAVGITNMGGISLTAGVITWLLRSGSLLASLAATMPAWRHFDPLPVVLVGDRKRRKRKADMAAAADQENKQIRGLRDLLDRKGDNERSDGGGKAV